MIVLDGPEGLTADIWRRIACEGAAVGPSLAALERVRASRALFLKHLDTGVVCYGVNTGLGALAGLDLGAGEMARLPRHILLGRSAGTGAPWPAEIGRGALLIRLAQFLTGYSAVTPELCAFMAVRLNDGFVPLIPSEGHGMAGEIIPLSHMAQTLIGEGFVAGPDGPVLAADWFRARGLAPYSPQPKEGLSLIGGVAVAPALAFRMADALARLLALATLAAAMTVEGLAAPLEAFSPDVPALRPDPGIGPICDAVRGLLAGSGVARRDRQPPVSVRVVPQVHGALLAATARLGAATLAECRAVGDNPAFVPDPDSPAFGRLVHCGNFHSAELTQAIEAAALAAQQVAILSERRLHRLLDARFSGLAPQLARNPGLDAGLVILHKAALGHGARLRALSIPPSLQSGETSFGQEDFMTMALPVLDRLAEVDRTARRMIACELYAGAVALDQQGSEPGLGVAAARAAIRAGIPPYAGDRPYGPEIERLLELVGRPDFPLPVLENP
jgi:histidine ammonia-lyase